MPLRGGLEGARLRGREEAVQALFQAAAAVVVGAVRGWIATPVLDELVDDLDGSAPVHDLSLYGRLAAAVSPALLQRFFKIDTLPIFL